MVIWAALSCASLKERIAPEGTADSFQIIGLGVRGSGWAEPRTRFAAISLVGLPSAIDRMCRRLRAAALPPGAS